MTGAAGIAQLIEGGKAQFVAEARCPRTLFSKLASETEPTVDLVFDEEMIREPLFVVPGVIAVADCDLPTADAAAIWRRAGDTVAVRRGTWLVRGRAVKQDLASSLLMLRVVDHLEDHEMSIRPHGDQDGNTRLEIQIPPAQQGRLGDEAFIAQAWQAALAYLPSCSAFQLDDGSDNFFAAELEVKLDGLPLWNEGEEWDPLMAATRLLGMPLDDAAQG